MFSRPLEDVAKTKVCATPFGPCGVFKWLPQLLSFSPVPPGLRRIPPPCSIRSAEQKVGLSASFWSKSVAGGCPMLGQDRDNDVARVQQDGFVLLCRELDEAQSPEQEKSFNGQQSVTNVMGIA